MSKLPNETVGKFLDREHPARCLGCGTPYNRIDAKWVNGTLRDICIACGLDQTSAEAAAIAHSKGLLWHQRILFY
jgi:hypothetical protein